MKRRDFEAVALGIRRGGRTRDERKRVAESVADRLEAERGNSNFNRKQFVSLATGFPER